MIDFAPFSKGTGFLYSKFRPLRINFIPQNHNLELFSPPNKNQYGD